MSNEEEHASVASLTRVSMAALLTAERKTAGALLSAYPVAALEQDEVMRSWFAPELLATYLRIKRVELAEVSRLSETEQCEWYARAY